MSVITIARGTLSATLKLSDFLAENLQYQVVSREDVYEAAKIYGIEETGLGTAGIVDQQPPSFWHRFTEKRRQYLTCFQAALMDFAIKGNLIYVGHLGHLLLSGFPPVLRIRLAAPHEYRMQQLQKERGVNEEEATRIIKDIDERRLKWSQFLYGVDWRDPSHYDLVLNPEKFNLETAGKIVIECVKSSEFQPTDEHVQILKNMRFAAVIQTALYNSPRTRGLELEITADFVAGLVKVYGKIPGIGSETWGKDIRNVVSEVEGVKEIEITSSVTQIVD